MQSLTEIEDIKSTLRLLLSKGWDDGVRILDQYEFKNRKFGECCSLQVLDYGTCEWLPCKLNGKDEYSLNQINKIIRHDLDWDGPIRLAVAA